MMSENFRFKSFQLPLLSILMVSGIFMSGCASTPPPLELIAVSKAAVNEANNAGANELAPIQYKSAMEKMNAADLAMAQKDFPLAQQLAEQAQVDAKLAVAMARSAKAKKAADAVQEDSRILSQEIGRKTK
jgi:Domain of unknown function (DUF4398)